MPIGWMWAFLDCPAAEAETAWGFWCAATGSTLSARRGERGEFSTLLPAAGDGWVKVQSVGGAGGVHLDLDTTDLDPALATATAAGATVLHRLNAPGATMASPGGMTFCLTRAGDPRHQVRELDALLDQVCLDIPADRYETEVAFWSRLTGWPVRAGRRPEFHYLERPHGMPLRLLLQRLDTSGGEVTAHPDLACADRSSEVVRHDGLGAEVVRVEEHWTTLQAPGGQRYCLTDRSPQTGTLA